MTEVRYALAKLTLSLRIVGVRNDGYHLLDAEMVSVDLADRLKFDDALRSTVAVVGDVHGVAAIPTDERNLVMRALRAVGRSAEVRVDKRIPAGAGLGGGSSDAAAVLRWAGCGDVDTAARLGADVPFCIRGGRARVTGVGERIEKLAPLAGDNAVFTLSIPPLAVSTVAVYRAWDELGGPTAEGANDLEPAALRVEPRLIQWRDRLGDATGITPVLAGSGSTWWVPGAFAHAGTVVHCVAPADLEDVAV
jgi:4-diphosphocytidyl-2-C-methyl-D-erythritol kinase